MRHMVSFYCILVSLGTLRCPGVFSGLFILRQNLPQCILKLNITYTQLHDAFNEKKHLQINKKMIKIKNKGILMCLLGVVGCRFFPLILIII